MCVYDIKNPMLVTEETNYTYVPSDTVNSII